MMRKAVAAPTASTRGSRSNPGSGSTTRARPTKWTVDAAAATSTAAGTPTAATTIAGTAAASVSARRFRPMAARTRRSSAALGHLARQPHGEGNQADRGGHAGERPEADASGVERRLNWVAGRHREAERDGFAVAGAWHLLFHLVEKRGGPDTGRQIDEALKTEQLREIGHVGMGGDEGGREVGERDRLPLVVIVGTDLEELTDDADDLDLGDRCRAAPGDLFGLLVELMGEVLHAITDPDAEAAGMRLRQHGLIRGSWVRQPPADEARLGNREWFSGHRDHDREVALLVARGGAGWSPSCRYATAPATSGPPVTAANVVLVLREEHDLGNVAHRHQAVGGGHAPPGARGGRHGPPAATTTTTTSSSDGPGVATDDPPCPVPDGGGHRDSSLRLGVTRTRAARADGAIASVAASSSAAGTAPATHSHGIGADGSTCSPSANVLQTMRPSASPSGTPSSTATPARSAPWLATVRRSCELEKPSIRSSASSRRRSRTEDVS